MSKKFSQFTAQNTVDDSDFINITGATNRRIQWPNFLDNIYDRIVTPFIYPTVIELQAAPLRADQDNPVYVRVEETEYRLYKITTQAPGVDDIVLSNGNIATAQTEYIGYFADLIIDTVSDFSALDAPVGSQVRTKGCLTVGDGGGGTFIVEEASGTTDGYSRVLLANGFHAVLQAVNGCYSVLQFGVVADGSTDNTATFQNAIDRCSTGNITLILCHGVILVGRSGNTITSRHYGILIPGNLRMKGPGSLFCAIKAADNSDMDVVTTNRTTEVFDIHLSGFSVDGNAANQTPTGPNQTAGGMNLWLDFVTRMYLDDLASIDSAAFGFRLTRINEFVYGTLRCNHGPDINADGVHIKDSSHGVIDKLLIITEGDDGFIINADSSDVHDISIGEVVVHAPVFVAAGRGIYISTAEARVSAGTQRKIYNISIANAVTYNCDATALSLWYADFYNIHINHVDYGSVVGCGFQYGGALGAGVVGGFKNCKISSSLYNPQTLGVETFVSNGKMSFCDLDFRIHNPGDGSVGAQLSAEDSNISVLLDYDPNSDKTTPSNGLMNNGVLARNQINATIVGANRGIRLTTGSEDNTIYVGSIRDSVLYDIDFDTGSSNNTVIGGKLNSVRNVSSGNRYIGVRGATGSGRVTLSPDASGEALITHGLIATPIDIKVDYFGGGQVIVNAEAADATTIRVQFRDFAGVNITTGSHQVSWSATI